MWIWNNKQKVEKHLKEYMKLDSFPKIEGYDFDSKFDFSDFVGSYLHMGFQGSNFGTAVSIFNEMIEEKKKNKANIFLSFTGNMISSGNREIIKFLVKNKLIDGITTTAAALEEDVIKCVKPFYLGSFDVKGKFLHEECIGRIGNIFVPFDRYLYLERFLNSLFEKIYEKQKKHGVVCSHEFAKEMGLYVKEDENTKENYESSFLYWAAVNDIPVFCPGVTDGAIGDISTFFKRKHKDFAIDSVGDNEALTKLLMSCGKAGCIVLGGGIAKHFLLNSAIFRDGFEYSIYVTTATEHDGSDSGGNPEEAITWSKIKPEGKRVKVVADATLMFPLLVASIVGKK